MTEYKLYAIDESARTHINSLSDVSFSDAVKLTSQRKFDREKQLVSALGENATMDRGIGIYFRYFNCHNVGTVGVININDELSHEASWYGISYKEIAYAIKDFEEDSEINTILLDINSPGGEVDGLMEFAQVMKACKKPIYAYCEGLTASAAMLLASCTKKIYTTQSTTLGSIGVMAVAWKFDKAYQEAGIEKKIFRSPNAPKKNLDPFGKEGGAEVEKAIAETEGYFLNELANNRGVALEDAINKFGQGATFHADEALERGLADEIVLDFDDCVAKILPSDAEGGGVMMASENLTIETLKAQHPELASSLVKEGHDAGFAEGRAKGVTEGTDAERQRVVALEELRGTSAVADGIIAEAIANGDTAEKACVSIVKKQKENPVQKPANASANVDELVDESARDTVNPAPVATDTAESVIKSASARAVEILKNAKKK